jgi:hypothetical protein
MATRILKKTDRVRQRGAEDKKGEMTGGIIQRFLLVLNLPKT